MELFISRLHPHTSCNEVKECADSIVQADNIVPLEIQCQSSKLEEGDVKGAVQLAASDMTLAPFDEATAEVLRNKHPTRTAVSTPPSPTSVNTCLNLSCHDVQQAIRSFRPGSAGGLDRLRPQHLKDMTSGLTEDAGVRLLSQLK